MKRKRDTGGGGGKEEPLGKMRDLWDCYGHTETGVLDRVYIEMGSRMRLYRTG